MIVRPRPSVAPAAGRGASRRALLAALPALAGSLLACSDLLSRTEAAGRFLTDPALDAYAPVLDALAATILPLEAPGFPLRDPRALTERLLDLFPLEKERRFLGLQKTLLLFDATALFPQVAGPIEAVEREQLKGFRPLLAGEAERALAAKRAADQAAWALFAGTAGGAPPRFVALAPDRRREYFALWGSSAFVLRREFRHATRALFLTAAYSLDEVWRAIGYAGPLVAERSGAGA